MPTIIINTDELLSPTEATEALNIGIATLYRWMKAGKIIPLHLGNRTLIPKSEIERLRQEGQKI